MKYYAMGDLHGRYDLLLLAFEKITLHAQVSDYRIITLGDYIDRGPQSKQIIDYLRDQQDGSQRGSQLICLQGNHEAMMVESIVNKLQPDWWVNNGGGQTLLSYGHPDVSYMHEVSYAHVPEDHLKWLSALPLYHEAEKQVFVHAGIPQWGMNLPPNNSPKGDQLRQKMQWMLYDKNTSGGWKGKHVVHGHHQFEDGPHQWISEKTGGRTDLDCWAYYTGRLVIGVFDDTQLHAKEFIEVLAV